MDVTDTYFILLLVFLSVFPVAFWAKKKFYPKEYKKEIATLFSTRFFVLVLVIFIINMLVKVFW